VLQIVLMRLFLDFNSKHKHAHNIKLAKYILKHIGIKNIKKIIALDGYYQKTTIILRTYLRIASKYVLVPEIDKETHERQKKYGLCTAINEPLGDVISKYGSDANVLYADYTGTIDGNISRNLFPKDDIENFLMANTNDKIVLAATFSQRCKRKLKGISAVEHTERILLDIIERAGYTITKSEIPHKYTRENGNKKSAHMVFFIYSLSK